MDLLNSNCQSTSSAFGRTADTLDPLLQQMSGIRDVPTLPDPSTRRRFSDTDRPRPSASLTAASESVAILSKDGTRWLPAPDEQSHRVGAATSDTTQFEPRQSEPLEKHLCAVKVCSVLKTFETTELLELILSFLQSKHVLMLRRMSQSWNSTVHDSPRLRLHFFTYGQWNRPPAEFLPLPLSIPGLTFERGQELYLGQWISISLTPEAARLISPNVRPQRRVRSRSIFEGLLGGLGTRAKAEAASDKWTSASTNAVSETAGGVSYEDLYVTQPPLVGMQAFILYSGVATSSVAGNDVETRLKACAKLSCDAGITLGFLAETAQSLLTDNEGPSDTCATKVVFKAIMSFCAPETIPRKRSSTKTVTRLGSKHGLRE